MESKSKAPLVIGSLVAVVLVVGTVVFFMNNNNEETASNQNQPAQTEQTTPSETQRRVNNIVVLATNTETLSTLVSAVKAAELVDTLQGQGPFTVFAPTNEAFSALPAGTLDTLLKPENKGQLSEILTYHVVTGKVMASDLSDGQVITTVQGGTLTVKIMDGKVYLVDAKGNQVMVEQADVNADNGVVHVIGGVLLPA